jgi:hypothetical protein
MGLDPYIDRRRDEILEVAHRHGASNVRIFGSRARGPASANSDVDLLVSLEPGRSLLDHVALRQDLEELLGLQHIRDSARRIAEYTAAGKEAFLQDTKTQDAVIRNLEIIGTPP